MPNKKWFYLVIIEESRKHYITRSIFLRLTEKNNFVLDSMFGPVALLKMVAPGAGFRGGTLFRNKHWRRPKKKGLRCKINGFSVQKYVKTKKKKGLRLKISTFLVQLRMRTTKQSEKSKVFTTSRWSHGFTS